MLYIISTTINYMHQLCLLYMLNYSSHLLTERERESKRARNCVYLARLKLVPSYNQELVSHPMPEHIEALKLV